MSYTWLDGIIAGIVAVVSYGVYKIWSRSGPAFARTNSPRTEHNKLGNPIHDSEDDDQYSLAYEELDQEMGSAECPLSRSDCSSVLAFARTNSPRSTHNKLEITEDHGYYNFTNDDEELDLKQHNARSYSTRTTHSKFGNPILVIKDQAHYDSAVEELDREIRTAEHPLLGFACRWKQEIRTGRMISVELQLAQPNGICVLVDLNKMGVPQKLRELLSKSAVVGSGCIGGVLFLAENYNISVRNAIDLHRLFDKSPEVQTVIFNERNLRRFICDIGIENEYSDYALQCITSTAIKAAKAIEKNVSVILNIDHRRIISFVPYTVNNAFNYDIHVVSDRYHCRWIVEKLERREIRDSILCHCVGFDCEWIQQMDEANPVALVQIADQTGLCALMRLSEMGVPGELQRLLMNPFILKVGVNAISNAKQLKTDYNLDVQGVVDLRHFQPHEPNSLVALAQQEINVLLTARHKLGSSCSNWERTQLAEEQIQYAAEKAVAGVKVFESFYHQYNTFLKQIIGRTFHKNFAVPYFYSEEYFERLAEKRKLIKMKQNSDRVIRSMPESKQDFAQPESQQNQNISNAQISAAKIPNNSEQHVDYPYDAIQRQFFYQIHVVSDENHCRWVLGKLLQPSRKLLYLGFDCEWIPQSRQRKKRNPVALLQLADSDGTCALLRLCRMNVPDALRSLLEDPKVLKVGVNSIGHAKLLEADYKVCVRGVVDLRHFQHIPTKNGLAALAQQQLHVLLPKDDTSWSNWERRILAENQVQSAASDAIAALKIFESFYHKQDSQFENFVDKAYQRVDKPKRKPKAPSSGIDKMESSPISVFSNPIPPYDARPTVVIETSLQET